MTSGVTAPNTRPTSIPNTRPTSIKTPHTTRPTSIKTIVAQDATPAVASSEVTELERLKEVKVQPAVSAVPTVPTVVAKPSPIKSRSVGPNARLTLGSPTKSLASSNALGEIFDSFGIFLDYLVSNIVTGKKWITGMNTVRYSINCINCPKSKALYLYFCTSYT